MAFKSLTLVLFAVVLVAVVLGKEHQFDKEKIDEKVEKPVREMKKKSVCEREKVQCGAGRECAETEDGEPTCVCIKACEDKHRPVCGTNGKSYDNHCQLHREACVEGIKIHVQHDGHCANKPSPTPESVKPVVCYQNDRDLLRQKLIDWMVANEVPAGWFKEGKTYKDIIKMFFEKFDETADGNLDSNEMLTFVMANTTASNITRDGESENAILRGLCVDALIDISDDDADWLLNLEEFEKCMNPEFKPAVRSCSLEDKAYHDGAVTKVNCNSCVCACGNWVCTAMSCDEKEDSMDKMEKLEKEVEEKEEFDPAEALPEEMTEDEFQEYLKKLTEGDIIKDLPVKEIAEEAKFFEANLKDVLKPEADKVEVDKEMKFYKDKEEPIL
ncbi:follistatin-related protein 1-like [Glandiceps talaboti]